MNSSCRFLNNHGDITISWEKDDDKEMKKIIKKKMEEGYIFYIIKNKYFGLVSKKKKLNKMKDLKTNQIIVKDEDLDIFIKKSKNAEINANKTEDTFEVSHSADKPEDCIEHNTVAVKPPVAG